MYVRIVGFKQEGSELFIKDFRKFRRYNESQRESINQKSVQLNLKPVFTQTTKNQPVILAKQSVLYSNNYKIQPKTDLKR